MNTTLRWVKFEAVMNAIFANKGIGASKINSFKIDHIRELEKS